MAITAAIRPARPGGSAKGESREFLALSSELAGLAVRLLEKKAGAALMEGPAPAAPGFASVAFSPTSSVGGRRTAGGHFRGASGHVFPADPLNEFDEPVIRTRRLTTSIGDGLAPWADLIGRPATIPGMGEASACAIFAEIGPDIDAFP